jgi:uncharacterized membrane protein
MDICFKFLSLLQVPFNNKSVRTFFNTHPHHPSILSISDLLDEFGIENAAIKIGKDNFSQIPTPFIAKTQSSEGDYCLVTQLDNANLTYQNEKGKIVSTSLENFFRQYSGVVLVAEANENSTEHNYNANKQNYLIENLTIASFIAVAVFISFLSLLYLQNNGFSILLYFIKSLGVAVSILLLMQSFDANNPFITKLCSNASGNGCDNILNSSAAKIFNGKLSWSEVGFFYFTATLIALSISPTAAIFNLLGLLNLLALPYTFYSIYFQYKIAKQWCKLCLSIQLLLWLEFATNCSLYTGFTSANTFTIPALTTVAAFAFVMITWVVIKPFITKSLLTDKLQRDINQFKKDENIFHTLLGQQRSISNLVEEHKIVFGNPNASFEITFVSNPYCNPCAEMHHKLEALLVEERKNIKLNIIYTASSNPNDPKNQIIASLIKLYKTQGRMASEKAMKDWYKYGIRNSTQWLEKYAIINDDRIAEETMEQHRLWCDEKDISHTPALFINNHQYLSEYTLNDLKHFIHLSAKNNYAQAVPLV